VFQGSAERQGQDQASADIRDTNGFYSSRITGVPGATICASSEASQFVRRMQPWDSACPTNDGSGVP